VRPTEEVPCCPAAASTELNRVCQLDGRPCTSVMKSYATAASAAASKPPRMPVQQVLEAQLLQRAPVPPLCGQQEQQTVQMYCCRAHGRGLCCCCCVKAGKTALALALEKQQGSTAALLAEALANRGLATTTPTGRAPAAGLVSITHIHHASAPRGMCCTVLLLQDDSISNSCSLMLCLCTNMVLFCLFSCGQLLLSRLQHHPHGCCPLSLPPDSPTAWQAAQWQQQSAPGQLGSLPSLDRLQLGTSAATAPVGTNAAGGLGSYPIVPGPFK